MISSVDRARIPHSEFAIPHFRRGISLLEVLISMFILAVGLLSIASLLPVGGYQVQKAMIDDRMSAIGQNAFHEFRTRGMANASNWVGMPAMPQSQTFPKPASVAIDPLVFTSPLVGGQPSRVFPRLSQSGPADNAPRMTRVGLKFVSHQNPIMAHHIAQQIFMARDDTVHEKHPTDPDASSISKWEVDNNGQPTRRQFEGNFSWLATLTPAHFQTTPRGPWVWPTEYHLSIAVFFKRNINSPINDDGVEVERQAPVLNQNPGHLAGFGFGGGELFISGKPAETAIRSDSWVMVCGYYGNNPNLDLPVFRWYRVVTVGEYEADKGIRAITLAGPDWIADPTAQICKPTHIAIFEGCVGVYEKTVHLEGPSSWSQ